MFNFWNDIFLNACRLGFTQKDEYVSTKTCADLSASLADQRTTDNAKDSILSELCLLHI